jgi:signal transduction histidine kinase
MMTKVRDMSNLIELERQKATSAIKTIAFASAAHEFRNPLNGIIASLSILKDKVDQRGQMFLEIAINCANLMLFLMSDILDFA